MNISKTIINYIDTNPSKKTIYTINVAVLMGLVGVFIYFLMLSYSIFFKSTVDFTDSYRSLFIPLLSLVTLFLLKFRLFGFSKFLYILGAMFVFSFYPLFWGRLSKEILLLTPIFIIILSAVSQIIFCHKKERLWYYLTLAILFSILIFFYDFLKYFYLEIAIRQLAKADFFVLRILYILAFFTINMIIRFTNKLNEKIQLNLDKSNHELEKSRSNLLNQNIQLKQFQNEILNQNEELKAFTEELQAKNELIELKNQNLNINYLYTAELKEILKNDNKLFLDSMSNFVCDRSITHVSSNLFWVKESNDNLYFILVDVKGKLGTSSILSVLIIKLLNVIVKEKMSLSAILDALYTKIRIIHQKSSIISSKPEDILEITLCNLNKKKKELKVLTVNQKLLLKQADDFIDIKSKLISSENNLPKYSEEKILLTKDSITYLFTNSCFNQMGKGGLRKLTYTRFRQLIKENKDFSLSQQEDNIKTYMDKWRGDEKQSENMKLIALKLY